MIPRSARGQVARLADLVGLAGVRPVRALEVTPYVAARAALRPRATSPRPVLAGGGDGRAHPLLRPSPETPSGGRRPLPGDASPEERTGALAVNAVLRWEYRLGSTFFLVYTRAQSEPGWDGASPAPATLRPCELGRGPTIDTILVKWSRLWTGEGGFRSGCVPVGATVPVARGGAWRMLATRMPDPAASLRILVAEDDAAVARLYAAYAQSRGHSVIVAKDGAETLVTAAAELPDVVLLDISMPKLDGRDVLRQLKANPKTARIPVLVISAFGGDQNLRDLLLELGAWDVMEKPVDLQIAFNKAERLARTPPRA